MLKNLENLLNDCNLMDRDVDLLFRYTHTYIHLGHTFAYSKSKTCNLRNVSFLKIQMSLLYSSSGKNAADFVRAEVLIYEMTFS